MLTYTRVSRAGNGCMLRYTGLGYDCENASSMCGLVPVCATKLCKAAYISANLLTFCSADTHMEAVITSGCQSLD